MTVYKRSGPLSDMFVPYQVEVFVSVQKKRIYRSSIVATALLMLIAVPALLTGGGTSAYFSDNEQSTGNTFAAGPLDFTVSSEPTGATLFLDKAGQNFTLTMAPVANSLPFRYKVSAVASGNPAFCAAITAVGAAPLAYSGPAASLTTSDTNDLTPWSLTLSLPLPATGVVDGQLCNLDLTFEAYQEGGAVGTEYHDTEHVILNLIADPPVSAPQPVSVLAPPPPIETPTPPLEQIIQTEEAVVEVVVVVEPSPVPEPQPEVTPTPAPAPDEIVVPTPIPPPEPIPEPEVSAQ